MLRLQPRLKPSTSQLTTTFTVTADEFPALARTIKSHLVKDGFADWKVKPIQITDDYDIVKYLEEFDSKYSAERLFGLTVIRAASVDLSKHAYSASVIVTDDITPEDKCIPLELTRVALFIYDWFCYMTSNSLRRASDFLYILKDSTGSDISIVVRAERTRFIEFGQPSYIKIGQNSTLTKGIMKQVPVTNPKTVPGIRIVTNIGEVYSELFDGQVVPDDDELVEERVPDTAKSIVMDNDESDYDFSKFLTTPREPKVPIPDAVYAKNLDFTPVQPPCPPVSQTTSEAANVTAEINVLDNLTLYDQLDVARTYSPGTWGVEKIEKIDFDPVATSATTVNVGRHVINVISYIRPYCDHTYARLIIDSITEPSLTHGRDQNSMIARANYYINTFRGLSPNLEPLLLSFIYSNRPWA